jgi:hypothetical protein
VSRRQSGIFLQAIDNAHEFGIDVNMNCVINKLNAGARHKRHTFCSHQRLSLGIPTGNRPIRLKLAERAEESPHERTCQS